MFNDSKAPAKDFGLVIVNPTPPKHHYNNLAIILYATKPTKYYKSVCLQTLKSI